MWLSDHVRELYGLPPDVPVTPETLDALKHADDRERVRTAVQAAIDARSAFEVEFHAADVDAAIRALVPGEQLEVEEGRFLSIRASRSGRGLG